jgi:hypothetical protein
VESACKFEIQVGASSRDIRLSDTLCFKTGTEATEEARRSYPPNCSKSTTSTYVVSDDDFVKRFGLLHQNVLGMIEEDISRLDDGSFQPIHRNTLLKEAASFSIIAKALMKLTIRVASREVEDGPTRKRELKMIYANVQNLPLRNLVLFSQGRISFQLLDSLILLMNGMYSQGFRALVFGERKKSSQPEGASERDNLV